MERSKFEEDGCHKLEDMCTQKRRMQDGREGGQGPTRTVEPWSSSSPYFCLNYPAYKQRLHSTTSHYITYGLSASTVFFITNMPRARVVQEQKVTAVLPQRTRGLYKR